MLGDRNTFIALPFAVLATGGGAPEVAGVVGAGFVPFARVVAGDLLVQTVIGVPLALAVLAVPAVRGIRRTGPVRVI